MNKVSILMPVYNEEQFIAEAIESVIIQSHKNFELIIIDDYSTDNSYSISESYVNIDNRIKLVSNSDKGKTKAFNLGFKKSSGDFLCFFAGDDIMDIDSVYNRLAPILGGNDKFKASASKVKTTSKMTKFDNVIIPKNKYKGTLVGGAIMFNRSLGNIIFPIPEDLPNEDRWTELHIKFFADIFHVPVISLLYRIHLENSSSRTNTFLNKNIEMHKRFTVFSLFLNKYKNDLLESQKYFLNSMIIAEEYRYRENTLSLLFMRGLPLKEKIRFIFHSNKILYSIRIKLFSLFSGWG